MNDTEAIKAVQDGGRCQTETTIFGLREEPREVQARCVHRWRVVACDSDTELLADLEELTRGKRSAF